MSLRQLGFSLETIRERLAGYLDAAGEVLVEEFPQTMEDITVIEDYYTPATGRTR